MMNCPKFSDLPGFKSFTTLYLVCLFLVGHTEVIRLSGKCLYLLSHNLPAQCQVGFLFCFVFFKLAFQAFAFKVLVLFFSSLGPRKRSCVPHSESLPPTSLEYAAANRRPAPVPQAPAVFSGGSHDTDLEVHRRAG